jgi:hypothetical protein
MAAASADWGLSAFFPFGPTALVWANTRLPIASRAVAIKIFFMLKLLK